MNKPDQFQTTDNLIRVANEAGSWISHLNMLASAMEGRTRGYLEAARALPPSPQAERLVKSLEYDVKAVEDLRKQGPIFLS